MPSTCRVSFTDGADVTHTVTVAASSLYEAAVLGIAEFGRSGFAFGSISPATRIRVLAEPPAIAHELSVAKLQAWLDGKTKTPSEHAKKVTLRQLLGRGASIGAAPKLPCANSLHTPIEFQTIIKSRGMALAW